MALRIALPGTAVHLGKITSSKEASQDELIFEIQENSSGPESFDPVLDNLLIGTIELQTLSLGHENKTPHLGGGIFEMRLLKPSILAVEYSSLHGIILGVELDELMSHQHHVLGLKVGCF